ncbi:MAG: imidazolonepropionase [Caldisphaera sp.]|jgi:imidazolonepropionase|nr:MAG: imidazolonepropionase [Caldisphaera sp.]
MNKVDTLIINIGQLVYFKEPIRKIDSNNTVILENAGIAIKNGKILDVGKSEYIKSKFMSENIIDAKNCLVTPGLVDMHTHALFDGSREDELEKKLSGIDYSEILKSGGGIFKTVEKTRKSSLEYLIEKLEKVLSKALYLGTTTIEVKSGYGLDFENEMKLLKVINILKEKYDVIPTLLAHIFPKESSKESYIDMFINQLLPNVARYNFAKYVDVFCDEGAFNLEQTKLIFKEALKYGFKLRMHADQLKYIGCSRLLNEFPIGSLDHLESSPPENLEMIAKSNASAGLLPASMLAMLDDKKPRVEYLKNKAIISLGTDYSPNSPMISMQTVLDLSIYYLHFRPIEALAYSTINSAYSLGLNDVGTIKVGGRADLIIWDLENINQLGYYWGYDRIKTLIYKGKIIRTQDN